MAKAITGLKVIQTYITEKLREDFAQHVKVNHSKLSQSELIRGMISLYLQKPSFRTEVDKFVEVTKTI